MNIPRGMPVMERLFFYLASTNSFAMTMISLLDFTPYNKHKMQCKVLLTYVRSLCDSQQYLIALHLSYCYAILTKTIIYLFIVIVMLNLKCLR